MTHHHDVSDVVCSITIRFHEGEIANRNWLLEQVSDEERTTLRMSSMRADALRSGRTHILAPARILPRCDRYRFDVFLLVIVDTLDSLEGSTGGGNDTEIVSTGSHSWLETEVDSDDFSLEGSELELIQLVNIGCGLNSSFDLGAIVVLYPLGIRLLGLVFDGELLTKFALVSISSLHVEEGLDLQFLVELGLHPPDFRFHDRRHFFFSEARVTKDPWLHS